MKLTVLGKYGPFPKPSCGTSSYLLQTERAKFLLDAGEGSFSRLSAILSPAEVDVFFLSHFHFDHVADVGVYAYFFERLFASDGAKEKPILICPEDESAFAKSIKNLPFFSVVEVKDGDELSLFGTETTFFTMKHPVPTVGVRINDGEKTFVYTGDTNLCDNLPKLLKNADFALMDACFLEKDRGERKPHLCVSDCISAAENCGTRKVLLTHVNPSYDEKDILGEIGDKDFCRLAEENTSYNI